MRIAEVIEQADYVQQLVEVEHTKMKIKIDKCQQILEKLNLLDGLLQQKRDL